MAQDNQPGLASTGNQATEGLWKSEHRKTLGVLTGCVVLLWAVMMSVFPALPEISPAARISPSELGIVLAVSSLLMTLLSVPAGVLADRYGRRPPIVAGLALSAVAIFLAAASSSGPLLFFIGWLLFGIGRGLFLSPSFTVPVDLFPIQQRGKAIGVLAGGIGIGSVLGYVGGGLLLTVGSWRLILLVDGIALVIATLAVLTLPESSKQRLQSTLPSAFGQTFGWFTRRTVVLSGLVAGVSFAAGVAATFLVPFSLTALNASAFLIAAVFIPYEIVASIGTIVAGSISDRIGRKPVLVGCIALVAIALAALPIVGVSIWSIAVIYALIGLSEGPAISTTTTMVADEVIKVDPRRVGSALGANRLVQGIGPIIGPALGGVLVQQAGLGGRFWILATVCVLGVGLALLLRETKPRTEVA